MVLVPQEIITRSLRLIKVLGEGEPANSADLQVGWDVLITMLDAWNGDPGMVPDLCDDFVMPGFSAISDEVDVPEGSAGLKGMITYNLAVQMAPEFGADVPTVVAANAVSAMRNWRTRVGALHMGRMRHPDLARRSTFDISHG